MEYSAGMTSKPYLFKETKKAAIEVCKGTSINDIKVKSLEDNIFQLDSEAQRKRVAGTLVSRVNALDEFLINKLANSSLETSKLLVIYSIMKTDRLFFEFINEVFREKIILMDNHLEDKDFNIFFQIKMEESDKVATFSESTLKKLKSIYLKILFEGGLISALSGERVIKAPMIDYEVKQHISAIGDKMYVNALEGVR